MRSGGSLCAWKTQTSEMYSLIGSHEVAPQGEEELGVSLEWCNTDTEADVRAFDASGRPLRVIVEDYEVLTVVVEGTADGSAGPDPG
jgi:hypothetical protein